MTDPRTATAPCSIKPGVDARAMTPQNLLAILTAQQLMFSRGIPFVITSLCDGKHMEGSKHYEGNAFDFRLPSRYTGKASSDIEVHAELSAALGRSYDVVLEKDPDHMENAHLHVEFDPKKVPAI